MELFYLFYHKCSTVVFFYTNPVLLKGRKMVEHTGPNTKAWWRLLINIYVFFEIVGGEKDR